MRIANFFGTSMLLILLAGSGSVYAQESRQEPKESPEPKPETSAPAGRSPEEMKAPKQQDEAKQEKREEGGRDESKSEKNTSGNQADHNTQNTPRSNPAGTHSRIPADKFRAHFGRQHTFSVHTTTVEGRPQFQYGGYTFNIVEVWPVDWAYTDDCYIDYVDGEYFLFDLRHPGVRLALVVIL
jgi:hypothetical protein